MVDMEKLVSLCKRRGFIYPGSEIYGGINGFWDYGPMGVELKRNIKEQWWKNMVQNRDNCVGVDCAIIMHPDVWKTSGHVDGFHDPMVDCVDCKKRFRADHLEGTKCPECGGALTEPKQFNLMFKTHIGAVEDSQSVAYLRPETAQGIFVQYINVLNDSRLKPPFGIAQIGKSFRNEVNPRNFIFRSREFEQMEMEFFCHPKEADEWFEYWVKERREWYSYIGIKPENIRARRHEKEELAHYAKACVDLEYNFPFGWQELEGIANRQDFDLREHQKFSGKKLEYFDDETKETYIPYVIEPSAGVDRSILVALCDAYEEQVEPERTVLHFSPRIAPIEVGVFPLMKKPVLVEKAMEIEKKLRPHFRTFYDQVGSIGRRYRRQDECGTPCCLTVDYETIEKDNCVTLRDRDSLTQVRVPIETIIAEVRRFLDSLCEKKN